MGILTLACIVLSSFLGLMQWYAASVDLTEVKANVQDSMRDQVLKEIMKTK